ncbi:LOW QUALITY PROTEIN: plasmid stabilization system protein [Methylobacter tundripaludum SV96]|uniref:Plasmid stabilization system protein n=1 Tax=Methylobacter tundripaludum (strain ATCC BAA-1195 / DSM 17260 / SV96) TaxID=697282 RepID=G3IZL4_METTV|nr:LOW QUALITY PROTEIN: plasmid stabilization system protein [Methylobacter tundripaludum SV96]
MAEINWTAEAERWLWDIYDYIIQDKPDAAANVVSGIYAKAQLLTRFPRNRLSVSQRIRRRYSHLLYGHYRITYLIKSSKRIDILCVFHGSLDIDRFLL